MSFLGKLLIKIEVIAANRSWETKRRYLLRHGASIGEGTRLNCKVQDFGSEPYLVSVGKDCLFANSIHIITHDGGVKVLNSLNLFGGGAKWITWQKLK